MNDNEFKKQSMLDRLWNKKIMTPIRLIVKYTIRKMNKNIRFAIIIAFFICLVIAGACYYLCNSLFGSNLYRIVTITDRSEIYNIVESFERSYNDYTKGKFSSVGESDINSIIMNLNLMGDRRIIISDFDGNILFKYGNVSDKYINVNDELNAASETLKKEKRSKEYLDSIKKEQLVSYTNIKYNNKPAIVFFYVYAKTMQDKQYYGTKVNTLFLIISVIIFTALFLKMTKPKMKYLNDISLGLSKIADGDLNYRISEEGNDEISKIARNINDMAYEIRNRMEKERRAEKTKNDLITNVSHDLRTPLTSVMGYIGLIRDKKYESQKQMEEYLDIAFFKSQKIKSLMEDLFEYTKLSNYMVKLQREKVDITEFLSQLVEEYVPVFNENNLKISKNFDTNITVNIDVDKMLRVFENMFSNAIKYASKPCDFEICIKDMNQKARIQFSNRSEFIPKDKIDRLFDRFYRVDDSRNSVKATGSGLGLAISKNIVELHGGKIWAEYFKDKITFIIELDKMK